MEQATEQYFAMDLLRFSTAGSVDDGKSTLIGRLLYDTKSIFEDQLDAVERASRSSGEEEVNLALLTDGLRAEREQKITIDVAYRYFATPRRKFIVADTPGHIQYTRNMVTGASTADLTIILVDARKGLLEQSKRHAFIASLLQIPHVVIAVNKMDLVDYQESVFEEISRSFRELAQRLTIKTISFVPLSALKGDNVVEKGENMPWYQGATLLHVLETATSLSRRNGVDFRFPVQVVVRPNQDFRGFAGRVASGSVRVGEDVMALPSRKVSRVKGIHVFEGDLEHAKAGESVVVTLEDELDVSRGDMLVRPGNRPAETQRFQAFVCWMGEEPLEPGKSYVLLHGPRTVKATVERLEYRLNVNTVHREAAESLALNEVGRAVVHTASPVFADPYSANTETGAFVLCDPSTNVTVGAGMIHRTEVAADVRPQGPGAIWEPWNIPRGERESAQVNKGAVIWFTGLSGAGKSTVAKALEKRLFELGARTMLLDGDQVRFGLCKDLGFGEVDRRENIRRVGEVARLFLEQGTLALCAFISPYRRDRDEVRAICPDDRFVEVFVDVPIAEARARDPKGLYAKADAGQIAQFTGVSSPYEAPVAPEVHLLTAQESVEEAVERLLAVLRQRGILGV